ncbi:ABC transporter ATP-binding protein [Flavobacterium sp.]|uniref:ABC transporter ATP-binding protein n=1 Tax=Flavobacterium sp. TaxID=239 RepID=UPI00260D41F6|nr:ABC transporter ATP-binding protein [Flavobacterium sp.]
MLQVNNISFSYSDLLTIDSVSFSLAKGKNLAIIGESGCGKSTLLKLIYGLYDLNAGQIFWNGQEVLGPKFHLIPGMDFMKYLAQDFDLMPYVTVAENIGKFLSNMYPKQKKERIATLLELVEMTEFANIKVQFLSGGQMQRVAIARVLALEPEVVLLDEPFSHIDNFRKNSLRRKVFQYLKEKDITCIIATHDSKDILAYSDETLVIKNGKVFAHSDTKMLYENPENRYVASLYDDVNEIPNRLLNADSTEDKIILVYPYQLKVVEDSSFQVEVKASYFKGNGYLVEAGFQNQPIFFESEKPFQKADLVCLKYQK